MSQHPPPPARRGLDHLVTAVRDGPVEALDRWRVLAERWRVVEQLLRADGLADEDHLGAVGSALGAMLDAPSDERRHALFLLLTALRESVAPGAHG